jgi:ubiquinone/menaquinone biosynthesis C-methylase UbiE
MKTFFKKAFGVSTEQDSLGNKFRQKRMIFFKECLTRMQRPIKILDVGGNEDFWINSGFQHESDVKITILNLSKTKTNYPNLSSVSGDATDLSEYKDNEFDIAFSNSVIEHLYTKENQIKMANEMMRVGKKYFVQSPNKYFFMEPHYLIPYFQFFPKNLRLFILTKTKLSRNMKWERKAAQQYLDEIRLISGREYRGLFPGGNIWKEKFFCLSKSFIAHNFKLNN